MPLLYGEGGQKAFMRLQLEIMKKLDDESIFAWSKHEISPDTHQGLLAFHPLDFAMSGSVRQDSYGVLERGLNGVRYYNQKENTTFSITNKGLYLTCTARPIQVSGKWRQRDRHWYVPLKCTNNGVECYIVLKTRYDSPYALKVEKMSMWTDGQAELVQNSASPVQKRLFVIPQTGV